MTWILTASGRHFDYLQPTWDQVDIRDIATALSRLCRFTGHPSKFYSVAQHSVMASYLVSTPLALEALMHDAAEAYCGDVNTMLKGLLPDYKVIEKRVDQLIRERLNLPSAMSPAVRHADLVMLATERRDLMPEDETRWDCLQGIFPLMTPILAWNPEHAQERFLARWRELT